MGDDRFRFSQDRLHGADASGVGEEGGGRQRQASWRSDRYAEKLKALERENRELRQANEILRQASAYFAQAELDRWVKP
jgi:transposase-like protein